MYTDDYEWGDPNSECATEYEFGEKFGILGNYRKIKDFYLLPYIKNKRVLDIGCGRGKWIQFIQPMAKQIIGVDKREIVLLEANSRYPLSNVFFYKTNGNELSGILTNSIDFIFSIDALIRITEDILFQYIVEWKRVLKPLGRMCIHLPIDEKEGCRIRNFTPLLSKQQILNFFNYGGFYNIIIDEEIITHGVMVLINYNETH